MRIRVFSDIHLEFGPFDPPRMDADVVILAGDLWYRDKGIRWAAQHFRPERTICLAGNHEFYKDEIHEVLDACRTAAWETGVHFLENETVVIDGVRFIGSALWADFRLNGQDRMLDALKAAWRYMNDFRLIKVKEDGKSRRIIPADVVYMSRAAARFVHFEVDGWQPDDEGFHLAPGGERRLRFTPVVGSPRRPWRATVSAINALVPVTVRQSG